MKIYLIIELDGRSVYQVHAFSGPDGKERREAELARIAKEGGFPTDDTEFGGGFDESYVPGIGIWGHTYKAELAEIELDPEDLPRGEVIVVVDEGAVQSVLATNGLDKIVSDVVVVDKDCAESADPDADHHILVPPASWSGFPLPAENVDAVVKTAIRELNADVPVELVDFVINNL